MMFGEDGSCMAAYGLKHGTVTAPALEWKIVDGRLRILDYKGIVEDELTLLSHGPTKAVVRLQSGKIVTFKLHPIRSS